MSGWTQVVEAKEEMDKMIEKMDVQMNRVVKQVELSYLDGFNRFAEQKEKQVDHLIDNFNSKNVILNAKEKKIVELENFVDQLKNDLFIALNKNEEQIKLNLKQNHLISEIESQKQFLNKLVLDMKSEVRKQRALLTHLQLELEKLQHLDPAKIMGQTRTLLQLFKAPS